MSRLPAADLQSIARRLVLRERLAQVLHDQAWLDKLVANADIRYFVDDTSDVAVSAGRRAPAFYATDLRGRTVSLADLHGKAVVLNFWTTWSGYSRTELPLLRAFARQHPNFYVVALDYGEGARLVDRFVHAQRVQGLTVWLDGSGLAYTAYEVTGVPSTFFIDMHGILRGYNYGTLANAEVLNDLAQRALRTATTSTSTGIGR
jgi:thiol-disulfide isomerase/thioredoxin